MKEWNPGTKGWNPGERGPGGIRSLLPDRVVEVFWFEEARRTGDTKRPGSFFLIPEGTIREGQSGRAMSSIRDSYYAVRDELANSIRGYIWRTSCTVRVKCWMLYSYCTMHIKKQRARHTVLCTVLHSRL
jgi:hypothetical protein